MPKRKVLFAPWRMAFLLGPKDQGCFLCEAARAKAGDEAHWKELLLLHRDKHALIIMNRYPYIGGHLLAAPLRHTCDLAGLSEAESGALWEHARLCVDVLGKVMRPQGFNVGMNLGKAGGAGIEAHLHMHAMPRWLGDTNFLPIVGQTQTVPVALEELWEELRRAFKK
ncbi:MAG: HIT domain-containing protein [Planctomycetes bacterium]|nr:HIT domain-containing protein [Planctomycetota bacterium]